VLEVHSLVDEIRIFEAGALIASHAPLEGRGRSVIDPMHRKAASRAASQATGTASIILRRAGDLVARRSLDFYDAVGRVMAVRGNA
jgi:hypothetical protein